MGFRVLGASDILSRNIKGGRVLGFRIWCFGALQKHQSPRRVLFRISLALVAGMGVFVSGLGSLSRVSRH